MELGRPEVGGRATRFLRDWLVRAAVFAVSFVAVPAMIAAPPGARTVRAQDAIVVQSDQARNDFPVGVTFSLSFSAPAPPKEVRLQYALAPDGTGATAIADCNGTASIGCSYSLTSGRGIVIIPGATITYHWDITDTAGNHLATEPKVYVHEDTRFTFKTLTEENVTLYYHAGSQSGAQSVLDAAVKALRDVGALERTQVTFPVKVFLYSTAEEMQPAIAPGAINPGLSILGEVVYSDTAMVSSDVDTLDITRHEVAHIVTREATEGIFGGIPAWMNEGISVSAQKQMLGSHERALDAAIRSDTVFSIRQMSSSSAGSTPGTVGIFYGEAGSIIKHLIDAHGSDKFADLLATFKAGSTPDDAFQKVYGFDQLGLENEWRESVGLQPHAAAPTAERGGTSSTPASGGSSSSSGGSGAPSSAIVYGVIAALALMLTGAGFGLYATLRRRL
jgi:hypothetical protein